MTHNIVLLPGDGIGPEVIGAAADVLRDVGRAFGRDIHLRSYPIGAAALRKGDAPLPVETLEACTAADAVLLGAVGDPEFDNAPRERRPERGLLALRKALGAFANLRPARVFPGLEGSGPLKPDVARGTDMLIVRELAGGLYYGEPRGIDAGQAVNTMRYSEQEVRRIAHVAFTEARRRRRLVTSVDKSNVLETSELWRATVTEVAKEYPDVRLEHMLVDACAMHLALTPTRFDVILTENLFGDILSDEAGALVGSLGVLPSASLGGIGLYEPVHGSAPAIAGKNIANPIGAILSAAMLLRHSLSAEREAIAIEAAVESALGEARTADLARGSNEPVSCSDFADLVRSHLRHIVTSTAH